MRKRVPYRLFGIVTTVLALVVGVPSGTAKDHPVHRHLAKVIPHVKRIKPRPLAVGEASWYGIGDNTQGHRTASSVRFDTYKPMCAMRGVVPYGTWVKIVNLSNKAVARCRVMDYGPNAWTGRVIDLSYLIKRQLRMGGTAQVAVYR